jgi:hypothetical protein
MNIHKLAKQAGIKNDCDGIWCEAGQLQRFAELVAAHEREECAKVCAEIAEANKNTVILQGAANCCAASIRARSKT